MKIPFWTSADMHVSNKKKTKWSRKGNISGMKLPSSDAGTRYQYQYQYCRIQNSISISIPIPKMIKFKLNLKTIPRYLDILRSQANTQKIRASIAQLWIRHMNRVNYWCKGLRKRKYLAKDKNSNTS